MQRHRGLLGVLTLSLAVVSGAAGQGKVKANVGVLAGAAFAKASGSDTEGQDVKTRVGIAAGGFVNLAVTPRVSIEPELLYVQKGAKTDDGNVTVKIRIAYLEIPVLLKVSVPTKGSSNISPHFYAGPALGFKAGCNAKAKDNSSSTSISVDCDQPPFDTHFKSTDFNLVFGGGVNVGRAIVDARYDLGLSKIGDPSAPDVKTRTFYLLAGWTFRAP